MTAHRTHWAVKPHCLLSERGPLWTAVSNVLLNAVGKNSLQSLNPNSLKEVTAYFDRHWPQRNRNGSFTFVILATFSESGEHFSITKLVFN